MISASLTQLHRPALLTPLLVLDSFTLVSLVAALLCVLPGNRRPALRDGRVDPDAPGFNPLFFMHFQEMEAEDFEREIAGRIAAPEALYRSLVRDIHASGRVLARSKYRMLRWSYLSFMTGLLSGSAALVWQLVQGAI